MINVLLMFFFSSRRRHTRCALVTGVQTCALPICFVPRHRVPAGSRGSLARRRCDKDVHHLGCTDAVHQLSACRGRPRDRKSVVLGKRVSVRVVLGGGSINNKKNPLRTSYYMTIVRDNNIA